MISRGPLRPIELATAAVMGGLTVVLTLVGWLLPHASAVGALAAVPMGVVGHRDRPRATLAACVAASTVAFLVAGTGPLYGVFMCSLIGGLVGDFKRRGRGPWSVAAATAVIGPVLGALSDGFLSIFASARRLTLDQIRNASKGFTGVLSNAGLGPLVRPVNHLVDGAVRDWWITVGLFTIFAVVGATFLAWVVLGAILERLSAVQVEDRLEHPPDASEVDPLPVVLRDVAYRYPGAGEDALRGLSLSVSAGQFVAVVGPNGSGKSTLTRLLAGRAPTAGSITRPGSPGLGRRGGTAVVLQRPESQILGVRVADDVIWGLAPADAARVDVRGLLQTVGLGGMAERNTATLSGGELQRLALAAALARQPRLLLSDESTAMVDAEGRRALVALLAELPRRSAMTVLHVTHREEEAAVADRVIHLSNGRATAGPQLNGAATLPSIAVSRAGTGRILLRVERVSHTYAEGTPWAQPALEAVDLTVREGEGLLVVGGNGSGKSTLAWVLAGLLRPNHGVCLLDGRPVETRSGGVVLAFQHARLQLQRPTVGSEVRSAGGVDAEAADAALYAVDLDPARFRDRFVDTLSGGEMRRTAVAGLLARRPRVLVLDEPLAGLDESSRAGLLELLLDLRSEVGLTLVVISHDTEGMHRVCERAVRLDKGRLASEAVAAAGGPNAVRLGSGTST